ncbi:hypothetical protein TELCIR_01124 [Teladorsagia circumcincta]|uniref:Integral membrane protein, C.elegans Sra family n=1 Tax=Teladorsagia circumcincta TaxID=45464 RepID=A0A2G9V2Q9_TELCI|nr:hypothetical protein TELCIR_01124 [Teladorsagia circumcincta]
MSSSTLITFKLMERTYSFLVFIAVVRRVAATESHGDARDVLLNALVHAVLNPDLLEKDEAFIAFIRNSPQGEEILDEPPPERMECITNAAEIVKNWPWLSAMAFQSSLSMHHFALSASFVKPCDLSLMTSNCAVPNYLILCCVVGMVLSQTVLWMDRLAATLTPLLYVKYVVVAFLIPFLLLREDPYNDFVLTCIMTPIGSAAQINSLFYSFCCLNAVAVFINVCLFFTNKQQEKMMRFNVSGRYQAFENITVTKLVGMAAFSQLLVMTTYSAAMYVIRTRGDGLPDVLKQNMRIWFYLVPMATFIVPFVLLCGLRFVSQHRHTTIVRLTKEKCDQTAYMTRLTQMWQKQ